MHKSILSCPARCRGKDRSAMIASRVRGMIAAGTVLLVACATSRVWKSEPYVSGSRSDVTTARQSMTTSNALALLEKYIVEYVDRQKSGSPASDPLSQALRGAGKKPTVSTNGYGYVDVTTMHAGGRMTVTMKRKDVRFADVAGVDISNVIRGGITNAQSVVLRDANGEVLLSCPVGGSEELIPRLLASIEILCPNIKTAASRSTSDVGGTTP